MTTAHTAIPDQTVSSSTTSADRRQDRRQQHPDDQHFPWRTVLSWTGFGAGCAVLVLCAYIVKNAAHWNPHMGGPIWSFLILFALMLIAGLLIMGGITKAAAWVTTRFSDTDED